MSRCHDSLESLKARIAGLERASAGESGGEPAGLARTGHAGIDAALGGGLMRARLHEIFAFEADDAGCATGFVAALALRLGGTLVWLREGEAEKRGGQLHAPGLVEIGLAPSQVILGTLPDALAVLRAAADVTRCGDVGVAVVGLWGGPPPVGLPPSPRLGLAAPSSGVPRVRLRHPAHPRPRHELTAVALLGGGAHVEQAEMGTPAPAGAEDPGANGQRFDVVESDVGQGHGPVLRARSLMSG
ncbi:MAG: hypothetical protein IBJ05_06605, partial [Blastomonas sp.]|nr:hypothetical protein [Blastomonas sp.]